jgi:hypothetical protein
METLEEKYEDYTDEELCKEWNHLETLKLSDWLETKMDYVESLLKSRGVIAWNYKGEITQRDRD